MKKILVIAAALFLVLGANAQNLKYGVKAGLNLAQISKDTDIDNSEASDMLASFHVGGFMNVSFGQFFGLQPEVLFSMQGGKYAESLNLGYINVPVLFEVKPITNFSLLVGPQIGINIIDDDADVKTVDFAAVVGVQYTFINHLVVGARYNLGFTPVPDYDGVKGMANRVIQISIGWQF